MRRISPRYLSLIGQTLNVLILSIGLCGSITQANISDPEQLLENTNSSLMESVSPELGDEVQALIGAAHDNEGEIAGVYGVKDEDGLPDETAINELDIRNDLTGSTAEVFENQSDVDTSNMVASIASFYGPRFNGHETCNGETFNQNAMTLAAHKWLGETVCVSGNGKRVTARVNDCGPYQNIGKGKHKKRIPHRIRSFDLSKGLMKRLKGKAAGLLKVTVQLGPC